MALLGLAQPASADVISDWNEKAVAFGVSRNMGPPPAERIIAMTHVAMFDAVNSIERKYRPYLVQLPADGDRIEGGRGRGRRGHGPRRRRSAVAGRR